MRERIETIAQLEALYPGIATMSEATTQKETAIINDEYRQLLETSPFFALASIGPEGMDCSPRGDGAGFVRILDERTIAIPDRRGNNRLDTLRNIVGDPRVALLFLIPGWSECLRINGKAFVSAKPDLLAGFAVNGKLPATAIVVEIKTMYFQCARAIVRARLWDVDAQINRADLPSVGQLIKSAMQDFDADAYDEALPKRQAKTLY